MYGLSDKTIESLRNVCSHFPAIHEVIIYGSRARGDNRTGSDIDITLKGNAITSHELTNLSQEIDDLLLPYFVDISVFSEIKNQKLINNILQDGKVLYRHECA